MTALDRQHDCQIQVRFPLHAVIIAVENPAAFVPDVAMLAKLTMEYQIFNLCHPAPPNFH
jgi:hypothetical protein